MINLLTQQIIKEPNANAFVKARLEVVDWIGYALAGTATIQAVPFFNLQKRKGENEKQTL